jgi:site-specific recombinase XerD
MATPPAGTDDHTAPSELTALLASWRRHLAAQNMSPATLATYSAAVRGLDAFLTDQGMPRAAAAIRREHVEAFITHLLADWAPATAHNRYRALRSFFGWLVEEGEVPESPMARRKPPSLPEEPPRVLRDAELSRLLETCERDRTPVGRRDEAIIRVFVDTGARRGEVLGLTLDDIDLDTGLLRVTGKGARTRFVVIGASTVRAVNRYLRARGIRSRRCTPSCGSAARDPCASLGLRSSSATEVAPQAFQVASIHTNSAMTTHTRCWPRACRRPT